MKIPANLLIIGLHSNRPQSGKSTIAQAIAEAHSGKVYSIADGVRQIARDMDIAIAADAEGKDKDMPLPDFGGMTARRILIEIGNARCARNGDDYWVRKTIARIVADHPDGGVAIIDDVRRTIEGRSVEEAGGRVFTLERAGVKKIFDIGGWNSKPAHTLENNTTVADCAARVWELATENRAEAK